VITLSTNYEQQADGGYPQGRVYTRADNPTSEHAERLLAALEGGECALFGSGMAAVTAVFQSLLPGDHVLVSRVLYWGVRKWLAEFGLTWGLDVEFIDTADLDAAATAIRPGRTRLLWLETPANPMWEITDLAAACKLAQAAGVRVAVDNTVATPVLTRPFEHGADLVVHSASKYLNGHGDVLAGAVLSARRDPLWERIRSWRRNAGAMPGPFEAWLLQRGMRTLFLRVRQASDTAMAIATHFAGHPALSAVLYPGLPGHPGHAIAARQMDGGFDGMLSIRLVGGPGHALAALGEVRVFKRATSLGGVESLIEHRRSGEGPSSPVPDDQRPARHGRRRRAGRGRHDLASFRYSRRLRAGPAGGAAGCRSGRPHPRQGRPRAQDDRHLGPARSGAARTARSADPIRLRSLMGARGDHAVPGEHLRRPGRGAGLGSAEHRLVPPGRRSHVRGQHTVHHGATVDVRRHRR
jgi:cystathionine gamma-synthase